MKRSGKSRGDGPETISRPFLVVTGSIITASVAVIIFFVFVLGLGDEGDSVEAPFDPFTATATPAGQTPATTPPPIPPEVAGEPTSLSDGLEFIRISEGTGAQPRAGDLVTVDYTAWLEGGGVMSSTYGSGSGPFTFVLGKGNVNQGWEEGIPLMRVGGKYRLFVPAEVADAPIPNASIVPGSTVIFDIEIRSTAGPTPSPVPTTGDTGSPAPSQ